MVHQTINSGFCFLFNKIADSVRRTSDYQADGKTVAFSHVSASPSWVAAGAIGDTAATTQQQREGGGIGKRRRSCWVAPPDTRPPHCRHSGATRRMQLASRWLALVKVRQEMEDEISAEMHC